MLNHIKESGFEVPIEERSGVDALAVVTMNFESYGIQSYDKLVFEL